ncbi:GNAT family N-acetyltransferase [Paenibacillus larvae]
MIIREATTDDALELTELIKQVERESDFMLFGAEERIISPEQQMKKIEAVKQDENSIILVADINGKLVGYLIANGGFAKKNKHSTYLVIGILEEFTGKGIGKDLFNELETWASLNSIHRLELTVMKHNERAVSLYKKMGFEIEGVKRNSLLVNNIYVDEYYMSKLL